MAWEIPDYAIAGENLYKLIFKFENTIFLAAYSELFPGKHRNRELIAQYEIFSNKTNRQLMVVMYQNGNLDTGSLAKKLSLTPKEIRERLVFFKANGLRKDVADKYI